MAIYFFETISAAQAQGFNPGDSLVFSNPAEHGSDITVQYIPGGAFPQVTLVSGLTGRSVTFFASRPGGHGSYRSSLTILRPECG